MQWRTIFLALNSLTIGIVAVYSILEPTAGKRQVAPLNFPEHVPLSSWKITRHTLTKEFLNAKAIAKEATEVVRAANSYTYSKDDVLLTVEARYLVGTGGSVDKAIANYTDIDVKMLTNQSQRQLEGIGFYSLFTYQDRAYLSSCINSRGGSSVTSLQFSQNRYTRDLKFNLLFDWLLGKESIRDRRCLWSHLSIPINSSNPKQAYQILEEAWQDWYWWWQPRFPTL